MGQMHLLRILNLCDRRRLPQLRTAIVTDVSEERLNAVRKRFATLADRAGVRLACLNPTAEGFESALERLAPQGVNYIVACAQLPDVVNDSRRHLARYGVLNLFAGIKRGCGPLNLGDLHYDQQTITGNSGSRMEDMENVLRQTERGEMDTDASAGAVVGMRACSEGVQAVAAGTIANKIVLYPQLPDLPLTRVEDLPQRVSFSPGVGREVQSGQWSRRAEMELLDALLEI
jgi:threonine dehydrogenase-like Zn-dependent dehydrogenase